MVGIVYVAPFNLWRAINPNLLYPAHYIAKKSKESIIKIEGKNFEDAVFLHPYGMGFMLNQDEEYKHDIPENGICNLINELTVHEVIHSLISWKHETEIIVVDDLLL